MIVITAPTSRIGRQVVDRLLAADASLRVIARDPARLPAAVRDRVEVVSGSHGDPAVVAEAFDGADAVFWLVPADPRSDDVRAPTWTSAGRRAQHCSSAAWPGWSASQPSGGARPSSRTRGT